MLTGVGVYADTADNERRRRIAAILRQGDLAGLDSPPRPTLRRAPTEAGRGRARSAPSEPDIAEDNEADTCKAETGLRYLRAEAFRALGIIPPGQGRHDGKANVAGDLSGELSSLVRSERSNLLSTQDFTCPLDVDCDPETVLSRARAMADAAWQREMEDRDDLARMSLAALVRAIHCQADPDRLDAALAPDTDMYDSDDPDGLARAVNGYGEQQHRQQEYFGVMYDAQDHAAQQADPRHDAHAQQGQGGMYGDNKVNLTESVVADLHENQLYPRCVWPGRIDYGNDEQERPLQQEATFNYPDANTDTSYSA